MSYSNFDQIETTDRRARLIRWLTPGRKLAIVGGLTLLPALGIGVFLNGLFAGGAAAPPPASAKSEAQAGSAPQPAGDTAPELDHLRAEVALGDQRRMIEKMERPAVRTKIALAAPTARPLLPPPQLVAPPVIRLAASTTLNSPRSAPALQLAYLGSSQDGERGGEPLPRPAMGRLRPAALPPIERPGTTSLDPSLEPDSAEEPARWVARSAGPGRLRAGVATEGPTIPATTLVTGVLEQPVLWEQGGKAPQDDRYLVVLTEAVAGGDGRKLLPAGTRLLTSIQRISANGLVAMQAVALRGGHREIPLQSVAVRAVGGLPIVAGRADRGSEVAGLDAGQALLKGAEQGLDILNRAASTSQYSGPGGSGSTANYARNNPLAAFGSGLFGELGRVIAQRNQHAVRQVLDRPDLWFIPGGTAVELLFDRETAL